MKRQYSLSESGVIFVLGSLIVTIVQYILTAALGNAGYFAGMKISTWVAYPAGSVLFFLFVLVYSKVRKSDFVYISRIKTKPRPISFLMLPIISILLIIAFLPLTAMFIRFLNLIGYKGGVASPTEFNIGTYFLALFIMCLLPAFGEEIFMRGTVFNGVATRGGWFGITMTGLLFMLMHSNPYQTIFQFVFGCVLCMVFIISNSIWPCIILHFLNNFISITSTAYIPQIDNIGSHFGVLWPLYDILIAIGGIILLIFALYFYYRLSNSAKDENSGQYKIVTEDFTISAYAENEKKNNVFVDAFKFFGSLFKKSGYKNLENRFLDMADVEYVGKRPFSQEMGFWFAVILLSIEWVVILVLGIIG